MGRLALSSVPVALSSVPVPLGVPALSLQFRRREAWGFSPPHCLLHLLRKRPNSLGFPVTAQIVPKGK